MRLDSNEYIHGIGDHASRRIAGHNCWHNVQKCAEMCRNVHCGTIWRISECVCVCVPIPDDAGVSKECAVLWCGEHIIVYEIKERVVEVSVMMIYVCGISDSIAMERVGVWSRGRHGIELAAT